MVAGRVFGVVEVATHNREVSAEGPVQLAVEPTRVVGEGLCVGRKRVLEARVHQVHEMLDVKPEVESG